MGRQLKIKGMEVRKMFAGSDGRTWDKSGGKRAETGQVGGRRETMRLEGSKDGVEDVYAEKENVCDWKHLSLCGY